MADQSFQVSAQLDVSLFQALKGGEDKLPRFRLAIVQMQSDACVLRPGIKQLGMCMSPSSACSKSAGEQLRVLWAPARWDACLPAADLDFIY